jgi:hypothetical protein
MDNLMNYEDKYIKYKTKYLELKNNNINNNNNMIGGGKKKLKKKKIKTITNKLINNPMDNLMNLEGFQSIIVSKDDNIIFQYGDITYNKGYLASCRKSILAILYGMYNININKTLEELNIDDKIKLSNIEKSATIKNLLSARSGIYHPASNGGDDKNKPERYSKNPNDIFVYNNWDFNVLGTIFEQETGLTIYDALNDLGQKIEFEDYDLKFNKKQYKDRITQDKDTVLSIHPPYHIYLSARDMLKIGKLMINKGKYNGKQVVSKKWIEEITYLHTKKKEESPDLEYIGYGYTWWVFDENEDKQLHGAYMAQGAKGQSITVVPKLNLIIVTKNYLPYKSLLKKILDMYK